MKMRDLIYINPYIFVRKIVVKKNVKINIKMIRLWKINAGA